MAVIGDKEWQAARGATTNGQRWQYALGAVGARIEFTINGLLQGLRGELPGVKNIDLDRIVIPDSKLAQACVELMEDASSPSLVGHNYRTYLWGSILNQIDGNRFDTELMFVNSMLHDLGLTEKYHGTCAGAGCFTVDGNHAAEDVLGLTTPERAEAIRTAISVHLNIEVPGDIYGWEAHYMQAGAALDVMGRRYNDIPAGTKKAVLEKYPRLRLKEELVQWTDREAARHPGSRFAILRLLGVKDIIQGTPFDG